MLTNADVCSRMLTYNIWWQDVGDMLVDLGELRQALQVLSLLLSLLVLLVQKYTY